MSTRPVLCNYCRQRVWPKPNETLIVCPGCKLLTAKPENDVRSDFDYSSPSNEFIFGRDRGLRPKGSCHFNFFWKRNECVPRRSLNSQPSPLMLSPSSRPKKRAVLCGVTYNKAKCKLKGPINDVKNMRELLINSFGFRVEAILVLTEEEPEPEHIPTRKNIQTALRWLVEGCQRGDSLVFYFAGHGNRQADLNNDEVDGFDETICPVDFVKEGMIVDDDINSTIVNPLKEGVTLHAIIDACHSGTILDLIYVYDRNRGRWKDNKPPSGVNKDTCGGLAICLSACEDNEEAFDSSVFAGKKTNGALTYFFTEAVKRQPQLSYGSLLDSIQEKINENNKNISRRLFGKLSQKPLLSSSRQFDVYSKHFIL